jgi:ComF family protein
MWLLLFFQNLINIKKVCFQRYNNRHVKSFLKETLTDFVSLFYPQYCYACHEGLAKGEDIVCTKCMLDLPRSYYHKYRENALYNRLNGRIPLQFATAFFLFRKGGKVQRLLHALKYNNHPEIGETLGKVYGQELFEAEYHKQIDLIVPVPLHHARKRKRGYNQSEEFAKGLSQSLNIPTCSILDRVTPTESQTRKSKLKRWQNVSEVFKLNNTKAAVGKKIMLVDDVITTGATIEACAQTLLAESCASISVASIAYAQEGK